MTSALALHQLHVKGAVVIRPTNLTDRPITRAIAMPISFAKESQQLKEISEQKI